MLRKKSILSVRYFIDVTRFLKIILFFI